MLHESTEVTHYQEKLFGVSWWLIPVFSFLHTCTHFLIEPSLWSQTFLYTPWEMRFYFLLESSAKPNVRLEHRKGKTFLFFKLLLLSFILGLASVFFSQPVSQETCKIKKKGKWRWNIKTVQTRLQISLKKTNSTGLQICVISCQIFWVF